MRTRVLIATLPSLGEGGVGSLLKFVLNFFDPEIYDVDIVTNSAAKSDAENLSIANILRARWEVGIKQSSWNGLEVFTIGRRFSYLEPLHYLGNIKEWTQLAKHYEVHIVVSGFNHCGLAFAKSSYRFISWIATTFDDDRKGRKQEWAKPRQWVDTLWSPSLRGIESYILQNCSKNLVVSRYTANLIADRYRLSSSRLRIMTYPIDTDWFCPATQSRNLNVVSVGRWYDPRKNIDMLLKAFAIVKQRILEARLTLVGSLPEHISATLKENGINRDTVCLAGAVSDEKLSEFYQQGSVFALPSYQEGLGIVGLEAMACGLPVVATKCGGPEDYVLEGVNGYVVPINDHKAMAEKIIILLEDSHLRESMSVGARERVLKHYSMPAVSSIFEQTLGEVWPEFF